MLLGQLLRGKVADAVRLLPLASVTAPDHAARRPIVPAVYARYRDVEEFMAECGLNISRETARRRVHKFDPAFPATYINRAPVEATSGT
jgi:hypothetical protein